MKIFLVVTIDVEPDCTLSWRYSDPLQFTGVSTGIQQRLQPLFNKYHIVPTYLINNVVLEDQESCRVLQNLEGEFELGTHLHPEFLAPEKMHTDYAGKKAEANCCFYPPEIEYQKIANITHLFECCFGYRPTAFRAGRFSAGSNTISSLANLQYKVDTSVTPHITWKDNSREKPVDFSHAPEQPYFIKPGTILEEDARGHILQVPVSITTAKSSLWNEVKRTKFGIRDRIRSTRPLWLRPVYSTGQELLTLAQAYIHKYQHNDLLVLNMMFHNVEVMPGLSPYTKNERDCRAYLQVLEDFLVYCGNNSIQGIKLSEVYEHFRQ